MEVPKKILLGKVSDIKIGESKNYRAEGKDLIVVGTSDGPKGYVNFCTHMGGKLRCRSGMLHCDWHGARFECKTGKAESGTAAPEGSKLEVVELETQGDDLYYIHVEKKNPWALP